MFLGNLSIKKPRFLIILDTLKNTTLDTLDTPLDHYWTNTGPLLSQHRANTGHTLGLHRAKSGKIRQNPEISLDFSQNPEI